MKLLQVKLLVGLIKLFLGALIARLDVIVEVLVDEDVGNLLERVHFEHRFFLISFAPKVLQICRLGHSNRH